MTTKINKDQLGPLAISDEDVASISVSKLSGVGASNGDLLSWDADEQIWRPVPSGIGTINVDDEVPAGPVDGVNTTFILSRVPSPPRSLQLFRGGVLLRRGVDYTLDDESVEMATPPQVNDLLTAFYRS